MPHRYTRPAGAVSSVLLFVSAGCGSPAAAPPERLLRVHSEPFADSFTARLPDRLAQMNAVARTSRFTALEAVQRGDVDLALAPASVSYFAEVEDRLSGRQRVRAVSALHVAPVLVVASPATPIRQITDLRGPQPLPPGRAARPRKNFRFTWDKLHGLRLGADDYVTKPFDMQELLAPIHAVLRRTLPPLTRLTFGDVTVDFQTSTAWNSAGVALDLSRREFEILRYLAERPGTTVYRG